MQLKGEYNRVHNRVARVLEDANVKLGSVASDILGVSGRRIIRALIAGEQRPERLADKAVSCLRNKKGELRLALRGEVNRHQRYLLEVLLDDLERIEAQVVRMEGKIVERTAPYQKQLQRLTSIPGVDLITAWTILAELGDHMSAFVDAEHAASGAGLVPGSFESAGKRKSRRTRHGNCWLRRALCQSAWAVSHKKNCYLTANFYRRASGSGTKKAIVATEHQILIIAYHIVRDGSGYQERGGDFFDRFSAERTQRKLTARLERLGWQVVLKPLEAPAAQETRTAAQPATQETPAAPAPSRKVGRPCQCAERGVACTHGRAKPDPAPSRRAPAKPKPKPEPSATAQALRPSCARWGIACIHARNRIPLSLTPDLPENPTA